MLEFFYLTPLPGSEDHLKLHKAGVAMDSDMNRYDLNHVTTGHSRMSRADWDRVYRLAWERYYTLEHIETVLRRAATTKMNVSNTVFVITWFKGCITFEGVHPLEGGFMRLKFRRDRRSGLPIVPAWRFYPVYAVETVTKLVKWASLYMRLRRVYLGIKHDPRKTEYTDLAMTPVTDDEAATHELFQTKAAQAYIGQQRRLQDIRDHVVPTQPAAPEAQPVS